MKKNKSNYGNRYTAEDKARVVAEVQQRIDNGAVEIWSPVAKKWGCAPTSVRAWWKAAQEQQEETEEERRESYLGSFSSLEAGGGIEEPYKDVDDLRSALDRYERAREEVCRHNMALDGASEELSAAVAALQKMAEDL